MGNSKCRKCFRHEKKTVPYLGHAHACPYRNCHCKGCQPKRKCDSLNAKRVRPRLTSAPSYQLPMMAEMPHEEQARILAAGGIPHVKVPLPTSISSSSKDFDRLVARQAPPVVKTQPAASQGIRNIPRNMINALHQKRMPLSGPRPSSVSFLSASTSEAYSTPQISIQPLTNIDSKDIRQVIQIPSPAPRLINSAYFTDASSSKMTGSASQSNAVPRDEHPVFLLRPIGKLKIKSVSISRPSNSIRNCSEIPSSQGQNRFSRNTNYNHPIFETANQKGTFKRPVRAHQPTAVHFFQQSNSERDTVKQSSLLFQPIASTFSHNSRLSECSRNWSQSALAINSTSAVPDNPFLNTTRVTQFNSAPKSDDRSEHASTNQTEIPTCPPLMNSTSIFIKPDCLSYNPVRNHLEQKLTAADNLKCNSKFSLQVQEANSAADYKKVSEYKISSVRPFSSMEQPSASSMASPKLKIPENTLSSLNNNNSRKNVGLSCHSNSNLKAHESSEIIREDGLRIKENSIQDISVLTPSSTESFEHVASAEPSLISSTMSDQKNPFVDPGDLVHLADPVDFDVIGKLFHGFFNKITENIEAGNCQESNHQYGEQNKFITELSSLLNIQAHNKKEFSSFEDPIHVLKLMFPEIPLRFLLPIYNACDSTFFLAVQELCFILKNKHISPNLMARCSNILNSFTFLYAQLRNYNFSEV